jgi:hypothetical protein
MEGIAATLTAIRDRSCEFHRSLGQAKTADSLTGDQSIASKLPPDLVVAIRRLISTPLKARAAAIGENPDRASTNFL